MSDDAAGLKRNLRVEVDRALREGAGPESVVLILRDDGLPRALVTDANGNVHPKFLSLVDLLAMLDESATVRALAGTPHTHRVPALPQGTLLLDVEERPSGASSYAVTGYLEPHERLVTLIDGPETYTYGIPLPALVYRALWKAGRVLSLSLTMASPDLEGPPTPTTELYRYCLTHVYDLPNGTRESVCWPNLNYLEFPLDRVASDAVGGFLASPNDAGHFRVNRAHNAPHHEPRPFLEALEGGVPHDWLVPCGMTVEDLHLQRSETP